MMVTVGVCEGSSTMDKHDSYASTLQFACSSMMHTLIYLITTVF